MSSRSCALASSLLDAQRMKTLLPSFAITFMLCGPALAQPTPPSVSAVDVTLSMKSANVTRAHAVRVLEGGCSSLQVKAVDAEDEVSVCTDPRGGSLRLMIEWRTRTGQTEYRAKWDTAMTKGGAPVELGRVGGAVYAVNVK